MKGMKIEIERQCHDIHFAKQTSEMGEYNVKLWIIRKYSTLS